MKRNFGYRFIVLLSLLLAGSIVVGFLNDRNKKEIIRVLDNRISEIINFSIEGLYYQNGINGSFLRTNFSGRNEMGKACDIYETTQNSIILFYYYHNNMCNTCFKKGLSILEEFVHETQNEAIILSPQQNHRVFAKNMTDRGFTKFISVPVGTNPFDFIDQLNKPVFFSCVNGQIENSLFFDNKLPDEILEAYLQFHFLKYDNK